MPWQVGKSGAHRDAPVSLTTVRKSIGMEETHLTKQVTSLNGTTLTFVDESSIKRDGAAQVACSLQSRIIAAGVSLTNQLQQLGQVAPQ